MRSVPLLATLALAACAPPSDTGTVRVDPASVSAPSVPLASLDTMRVVVLGNSIAAGYGLPRGRADAFPTLVQARIDSLGWPFHVEAAAVSGSTTAGGLARIDGAMAGTGEGAALGARRGEVAILVVELGGNDVMRFVPPERTRANLTAIVARAQAASPDLRVLVAGLDLPGGFRHPLLDAYRAAFTTAADSAAGVTVLPSLLDGVVGVRSLNQGDALHPNVYGQRRIAATLWPVLRPMLEGALRGKGVAEREINGDGR